MCAISVLPSLDAEGFLVIEERDPAFASTAEALDPGAESGVHRATALHSGPEEDAVARAFGSLWKRLLDCSPRTGRDSFFAQAPFPSVHDRLA